MLNKFSLIILIVGIFLGFYVCILIKKFSILTLDPKVSFQANPFEIFSLVTNIILAIIVARTIARQNDTERKEKDLLINNLQKFSENFVTVVSDLLSQVDFDTPKTRASFKIYRKQLDSILKLCKEHDFLNEGNSNSQELRETVSNMWELFTDTPKQSKNRRNSQIAIDIETLRLEKITQINSSLIEVEKLVFKIIIEINRK